MSTSEVIGAQSSRFPYYPSMSNSVESHRSIYGAKRPWDVEIYGAKRLWDTSRAQACGATPEFDWI